MIFQKYGCPQRKTRDVKRGSAGSLKWRFNRCSGQVQWATGLFFILFLGIVLCVELQLRIYHSASLYLEDALAASNLASAVIDLQEYGRSHVIRITDVQAAYELYCNAVRGNLQLNEQWEGSNENLISGPVIVENYTVYNVAGENVTSCSVDNTGQVQYLEGSLGTVRAPNGIIIESTGVYSEISFPVEGIFGIRVTAHKGKLVDVVAQGDE